MLAPEPIFERQPDTDLFWLIGNNKAGFLASEGSGSSAQLSLSQTWNDVGGLYVFVADIVTEPTEFVDELRAWQNEMTAADITRFLWLDNRTQSLLGDIKLAIPLRRAIDPRTYSLGWFSQNPTQFSHGEIAVLLPVGLRFDVGQNGNHWQIAISESDDALVKVVGPRGDVSVQNTLGICFEPHRAGCVQALLAASFNSSEPSGLERLGASIRFFRQSNDGGYDTLALPPIVQDKKINLWMSNDPLRAFHKSRTYFAFHCPWTNEGPEAQVGQLPSGFVTSRGYPLTLKPLSASQTVVNSRLVFCKTPKGQPGDPYLSFQGRFEIKLAQAAHENDQQKFGMLCGLSGLETIWLNQSDSELIFQPDNPAFSPLIAENVDPGDGALDLEPPGEPLTNKATTAWVFPATDKGARYHAQPEDAPFYGLDAGGSLYFLDLQKAVFPAFQSTNPGIPLAPFAHIPPNENKLGRMLESEAIGPTRVIAIDRMASLNIQPPQLNAVEDPSLVLAVTPSGLIANIDFNSPDWEWIAFANNGADGGTGSSPEPDIRFTAVTGVFQNALFTNQLFMVLGNPDEVLGDVENSGPVSIEYRLTPETLGLISGLVPDVLPETIFRAVAEKVESEGYKTYRTEPSFYYMLTQAGCNSAQADIFLRYAGQMLARIGDWSFQLSPRNWVNSARIGAEQSFLLVKFATGRSIADFAEDVPSWTWPKASIPSEDPKDAQIEIRQKILSARMSVVAARAQGERSAFEKFISVVDDPDWTGVLALSVEAPLATLPDALKPLAAGIDKTLFHAHHIGLPATAYSLDEGTFSFDKTPSFALIEYEDPESQYFSQNIDFAFRVASLRAEFENAQLTGYSSRVQLMINRLFGSAARLFPTDDGNNIALEGTYLRQNARDDGISETYAFTMPDSCHLQLHGGALKWVSLTSAQMVASHAPKIAQGQDRTSATFMLSGTLEFEEPPFFDPYSFGPPNTEDVDLSVDQKDEVGANGEDEFESALKFSNLAITMSFPFSDPTDTTFTIAENNITLDPSGSIARPNALISRFPVRLTGLLTVNDKGENQGASPGDLGYVSINAPMQQGVLSAPWYGLVYHIELGSLGALAGNASLSAKLLAAWSPANASNIAAQFIGISLPGLKDDLGVDLPLQGILNLGFRSIDFNVFEDEDVRSYLLRLRDFGVRILGLSFPPGNNDISLFANPDQGAKSKLGWYAAYAAPTKTSGSKISSPKVPTSLDQSRPPLLPGNAYVKDDNAQ